MNNIIGGDIITFTYRHRKEIIIGVIATIIIVGIIIGIVISFSKEKKEEKDVEEEVVVEKKREIKKEEVEKVKVDIKGEINNPGIYSLTTDSRVIDVIAQAGGLTENADTSVINLSKKLSDEMVIIVYSKFQVQDFKKTKEIEVQVEEKCIQKDENALKNDACITSDSLKEEVKANGKISLNKATKEELMTLTGIGEAKAKDIINYRDKNGGFKTIEDLKKVNGIGDSIFAKIKENITV